MAPVDGKGLLICRDKEVKTSQILVLPTRLRQICDHPGLIDKMLEDDNSKNAYDDDDEKLPEIDLLEQLNVGDSTAEDENSREEEVISKASSKVLLRSNPVFEMSTASSKVGIFTPKLGHSLTFSSLAVPESN